MRLHYLQHVPFEDPANIVTWAQQQQATISCTRLDLDKPLPTLDSLDWLVIMGGPMNIYEETQYPWLVEEKRFIAKAIEHGKTVLGVCLGAQLLADVLGAPVARNHDKEIGWFPITLTPAAKTSPVTASLPESFHALHWHGDTFELPSGSLHFAESTACTNQGFLYDNRVLALQFHLESTPESLARLIHHCSDELVAGRYIQSAAQMSSATAYFSAAKNMLNALLDRLLFQTK